MLKLATLVGQVNGRELAIVPTGRNRVRLKMVERGSESFGESLKSPRSLVLGIKTCQIFIADRRRRKPVFDTLRPGMDDGGKSEMR